MKKNVGYFIGAGMVIGMIVGFMGIAWDESSTKWKGDASNAVMIAGWGLFAISLGCLAFLTWGSKKDR